MEVSLEINGKNYKSNIEPRILLVQYLREKLNLKGTNIGCDTSQCGACTIHINGKATKSCTIFAVQVNGSSITTIEGLTKNGIMHPVQKAFWENHAVQCGFCTPGMIMTSIDLLKNNPNPEEDEIREGLEGNFCRCTGYQNIIEAIKKASFYLKKEQDKKGENVH